MFGTIFDMDGLMFDTELLALEGWLKAGKVTGYPITVELINQIRGTNTAYSKALFLEVLGPEVDYEKMREIRTEYVNEYVNEHGMPVKEGLIELLQYLKENKIKAAVATSTHQELAEWYLRVSDVDRYFDAFVFGDMVKVSKPDPEIFHTAARKLGLRPEECCVFEDSPNGLKAGINAGGKVIAVPDLTPVSEELVDKVDAIVPNLAAAIPYLEKWR